ncbi:hypothetical protein CBR_g12556 [Chara braunii]|uniref:Carbohydrate-binding-like fold protein n=1 Tax=Chara braunii TaxID=69332 RepID=A0A388JSM2_CHABU|nr:hypothetical protein CBR_g12556 [Chara braunii]|eukprot:GBG60819.1 hypothetical protein CBR_g12556 [Chara braunii]
MHAKGWVGGKTKVTVAVDEHGCGGNEDINFHYTGFSLSGRVMGVAGGPSCKSPNHGPQGVNVTVSSLAGEEVSCTETGEDGSFSFGNLPTGRYLVSAFHSRWNIEGSPVEVTLGWGNAIVPDVLLVDGYDLEGSVVSQGNPVLGVQIYLFSDDVGNVKCPQGLGNPPQANYKYALCHGLSGTDGRFNFPAVPCGEYVVVPVYKGEHTVFDVSPQSQKVVVGHGKTTVDPPFQVTGFSIGGWVRDGAGQGIEGASILIDGVERVVTDDTGKYKIDQVTSARYTIEARKGTYKFSSLQKFMVLPNLDVLPDIKVTHYSLCGSVQVFDSRLAGQRQIELVVMGDQETRQVLEVDKDGRYCAQVEPGRYQLSPVVYPEERERGLLFAPAFEEVTISHKPVLNVHFSQALISISGRVRCIRAPCGSAVTVSLTPVPSNKVSGGTVSKQWNHTVVLGPDDSFIFKDVYPGTYIVTAKQPTWCWLKSSQEVSGLEDILGVEFIQKGYTMTITSMHEVSAVITSKHSMIKDVIKVGTQKWCLEHPEVHVVGFENPCLFFGQESFSFDPENPEPILLKATKYLVRGQLMVSSLKNADVNAIGHEFSVDVCKPNGERTETLQVTRVAVFNESSQRAVYGFSKWAEMGESFVFMPEHASLLFYPRHRQVTVVEDGCQLMMEPFDVRPGLTIEGLVAPPIEGVTVTVKFKKASAAAGSDAGRIAAVVTADNMGSYAAGPLFDDASYEVAAEKEGYHFRSLGSYNFEGQKLGQVVVNVRLTGVQDGEGEAMSGVLLSLSGAGGYRKNAVSGPTGSFSFTGLFPGSYFLRPMLKEYSFTPAAEAIVLKGGESKLVEFIARRVAYSVRGSVRALGGRPEEGVLVEARSQSGTQYEEARTDAQGQYRLRGLHPQAAYRVQVKLNAEIQSRIERSSPSKFEITIGVNDTENVDFVVFEQPATCTLTGTARPSTSQWQPHIKVQVVHAQSPDRVEREVPLPLSHFFAIPGLQKGKYIVRLVFGLPERTHNFKSNSVEVDLDANCQVHIGALEFEAEERHEKQELAPAPVIPVAVGLLIIVLAANMSRLQSTYSWVVGAATTTAAATGVNSGTGSGSGAAGAAQAAAADKRRDMKKLARRRIA